MLEISLLRRSFKNLFRKSFCLYSKYSTFFDWIDDSLDPIITFEFFEEILFGFYDFKQFYPD